MLGGRFVFALRQRSVAAFSGELYATRIGILTALFFTKWTRKLPVLLLPIGCRNWNRRFGSVSSTTGCANAALMYLHWSMTTNVGWFSKSCGPSSLQRKLTRRLRQLRP